MDLPLHHPDEGLEACHSRASGSSFGLPRKVRRAMSAKKPTLYVPLSVRYIDNDKVVRAGERAELLFIRALCKSKHLETGGELLTEHLERLGMAGTDELTAKLVEVGLFERTDIGVRIVGWDDWNPDAGEVRKARQVAAMKTNHLRWHVKAGKTDPDCPLCGPTKPQVDSVIIAERIGERIGDGTRSPIVSRSQSQRKPLAETPTASRPKDSVFDALVKAVGWNPAALTDPERGRLNKAVKQLLAVDATPDEIERRAGNYRAKWPTATVTPNAISSNWTTLATTSSSGNGSNVTPARPSPQDGMVAAQRRTAEANARRRDETADEPRMTAAQIQALRSFKIGTALDEVVV